MASERAVLCGYYGMGNMGDEALLAALLEMLPERITPVVLSGNPRFTRDRYGVEAIPRKATFEILGMLRSAQSFIWGGGSLMQDSSSALNPFYYGGLMGVAQQLGLRTIALAQGIGPLSQPWTRALTRRCLRGCDVVTVRDRNSAACLNAWGIPFTLAPDPVWALESRSPQGLWDLPAPRVAVILRPHPQLTPARLERLITAIAAFQNATQASIFLVPFQPSQDLDLARTIYARLPENRYLWQSDDPRALKGLFRGVEMAISMRLHGLIAAAAEGCRCWGLSYDPKVTQFLQEFDLPGWELQDLPNESTDISHAWLNHYANGKPLSKTLIQATIDRANLHRDLLCQGLG